MGRTVATVWVVDGHAVTKQAASASQMGRFETEVLATEENLAALADLSGQWIDRVHDRHPPTKIILGMDSSVSPTHGEQEETAYNGHFGCTCYHPLFLFNQFGDLERCSLRPGNVHSADDWEGVLKPVVIRYKGRKVRLYFRGDATFASTEIYEYLEAEEFLYAIRLPKNQVLQESISHFLTRPVGRPPNHVLRFYVSFSYQAGSWDRKGDGGRLEQWLQLSLLVQLVPMWAHDLFLEILGQLGVLLPPRRPGPVQGRRTAGKRKRNAVCRFDCRFDVGLPPPFAIAGHLQHMVGNGAKVQNGVVGHDDVIGDTAHLARSLGSVRDIVFVKKAA